MPEHAHQCGTTGGALCTAPPTSECMGNSLIDSWFIVVVHCMCKSGWRGVWMGCGVYGVCGGRGQNKGVSSLVPKAALVCASGMNL